jgi:hypothetical protein
MARQRYVYDAPMVAHLWANQSQDSARSSGRGNIFFEGPSIYSYGRHFEIARIHQVKGKPVVLFTNRSYSVTTSGHQSMCRGAARHLESFTVPDLDAKRHKANLDYFREEIKSGIAKVAKARQHKEWRINELQRTVATANRYCEVFGLKTRFTLPDLEKATSKKAAAQTKKVTLNRRTRRALAKNRYGGIPKRADWLMRNQARRMCRYSAWKIGMRKQSRIYILLRRMAWRDY